jgi:predicted  nucleic acid-binding Zn-ribbon protein
MERKIQERIKETRRRERRRKHLLYDVKEKRGYRKLKEEALDLTLRKTRFRRGYGHVVR